MRTKPHRFATRLFLSNWPLGIKFGLPIFAISLLIIWIEVASGLMFSDLRETLNDVIEHRFNASLFLAQQVDHLRIANDDLNMMIVKRAVNIQQDVPKETGTITAHLDEVSADLVAHQAEYASERNFTKSLGALKNYKDAVTFVGSMLEIDLNAPVNFILPLGTVYNQSLGYFSSISNNFLTASRAESQNRLAQAETQIHTLYLVNGMALLLTGILTLWIVTGTVRSIRKLAAATRSLADGDIEIDLESLARRDELGLVVQSLTIFRDNIRKVDRLTQERRQAEVVEQARSVFMANMSHELRTPLNAVLGCAALLADTQLEGKQKEYVDIIEGSARFLLEIITEILDYSKIEANKMMLRTDVFDLHATTKEQIRLMTPLASRKNLSLQLQIDPRVPTYLIGDESRLSQILFNLVGNALKFTFEGEVKVKLELLSSPEEPEAFIQFSVKDSGVGIPKNKQENLFQPFYQVSSGSQKLSPGTGLGLAIVKRFALMMGGSVRLESEEGEGATFFFSARLSLPSQQEIEIFEAAKAAEERGVAPIFGPKHLLVAEDVETNQFVIQHILKSLNCTCDICANGVELISMAKQKKADLILMDYHMPVMDGFEATKQLRATGFTDIPIIALTANAMKEDREKCLAIGMNDFVSKPIDRSELIRVLNKWLGPSVKAQEQAPPLALPPSSTPPPSAPPFSEAPLAEWRASMPDKVEELVRLSLTDAARLYDEILEAMESKNAETLEDSAHALKSVSRQIGGIALSDCCRTLELMGKKNDLTGLEENMAALKEAYRVFQTAVNAFIEKTKG